MSIEHDETQDRRAATHVSLVDVDPEFAAAIRDPERERARRTLVARLHRIAAGPFDPPALGLPESTFALLVLKGSLLYEARAAAGRMVDFIARGDLLPAATPEQGGRRGQISLTATEDVLAAGLDQRFVQTASVWPELMLVVQRRLSEQQDRVALHGAICQLPNAEQRLMAMFWHLADRVGKRTTDGVLVAHRPLSHQTLAELIGARRPTVSFALRNLRDRGFLRRLPDGSWLLPEPRAAETNFDELIARVAGPPPREPLVSPPAGGDGLLAADD